ncbi:Glutamate receptor 1-like 2 [Homarus americanus]|uniref:Glutamate receptor 1-like 2 n=1 Tax=Homarus americanus TaxID=6706 RepID=A0A8J5N8C2_HOMAM|nr:Glutamate receptor 1-like 2 [Homarus americanus]
MKSVICLFRGMCGCVLILTLHMCVLQFPPFLKVQRTPGGLRVSGSFTHINNIIASFLNTCVEYVMPEDQRFGNLENDTWTGIIGLLTRQEVDISGIFMFLDVRRQHVVDGSVWIYMDEKILAYKRPEPKADLGGFVKPYTVLVWCMILLALVVVFVAMVLTQLTQARLQRRLQEISLLGITKEQGTKGSRERKKAGERQDEAGRVGELVDDRVWTSWQWSMATPLAQSSPWNPRGMSIRVVAGIWLLTALVISSIYRSNLKAMLILPKVSPPFTSLEELLKTSIPCYVLQGTVLHGEILTAEPGSHLYKLRKQMISHVDVPRAVKDLLQGKHAALIPLTSHLNIQHNNFLRTRTCSIYMKPADLSSFPHRYLFPKGSPLVHKLNPLLTRLKESGVLDYLYFSDIYHGIKCLKTTTTTTLLRPLELGDFYGVFSLYGGGMLIAGLTFILELIVGVHRHNE